MSATPRTITLGVVGAGTMGAGIAQSGLTAGLEVVLYDAVPETRASATERIREGIRRGRERDRWKTDEDAAIASQLTVASAIDELSQCDLVVEAAPESLELKQELLGELMRACRPDAVIASNTSSIPLTLLAARAPDPSRVVGLHFFNPVPLMGLVEVIAAEQSSDEAVRRATEVGEALGKRVIRAPDGPGFLVNRCGRSFYGEPLRILGERIAEPAQVDRICRIGGGFRMGPFELMDLVGLDVNFAVAQSFAQLSFGEPRWRPTALQSRMVASGNLGRKTGRGWYTYGDRPHRPEDPPLPEPGGGSGRELAILGAGGLAAHLRALAQDAGFVVHASVVPTALATVFADADLDAAIDIASAPTPIVSCACRSLAARGLRGIVGFNVANLAGLGRLGELTHAKATSTADVQKATDLFTGLGMHVEWVADAPGLVLARILAQVVNEAAFAYGEGLATAADIDAGVKLGLNYPRGSLSWGRDLGWSDVLRTLDGIWQERREERYRPAPALIAASAGEPIEDDGG